MELWMMACTNPEAFAAYTRRERAPLRYHSSCVFLISETEGEIVRQPDIASWSSLPALHSISLQNSGRLARTTDLNNVPGYAFLLSKDKTDLPEQRNAIRASEQAIYRGMTIPIPATTKKVA